MDRDVNSEGKELELVAEQVESSEVHDQIMTGWDPVPPIAGCKRPHFPDPPISYGKRGRPVKMVDYYKCHEPTSKARVSSL